jgi:hypothetical protein
MMDMDMSETVNGYKQPDGMTNERLSDGTGI